MFRQYTTLPADSVNAVKHMDEARNDATALLLPRNHCAFQGCAWNGFEDFFVAHICDQHLPALTPGIEAFKALKPVHKFDEQILSLNQ